MSAFPVVLVSADNKSLNQVNWHMTPAQYAEAVLYGAGAMPLLLPPLGGSIDIDSILDRVDGVLLSGARSNVHPSLYGVEPTVSHEPYDAARDATTLPLIRVAIERGIPLLAICRGFQELNVALGGTLLTEIHAVDGRIDHRSPDSTCEDERYGLSHQVHVVEGGRLRQILSESDIPVNSLHRQGLDILAPELTVEANAADGTIEAVSVTKAKGFALGVQWHPEYWVRSDHSSVKLFAAFGEAVRVYAAERAKRAVTV
ncbi:MAG: gamma-glutamyl-gamma-aminobutyrate hydrolase family protein [Ancalomicrobiaceae bacterium]|nr:gamma-glutamyl-gamma-aminobutyrate hydrolase family protein [Ancalomicrobiaceae bacterium]